MLSGACLNFKGYDVVCIQLHYLPGVSSRNIVETSRCLYANAFAKLQRVANDIEIEMRSAASDTT